MQLTFLGSGDAFGSGGRFNTCFHVAAAEGNFLIDCGASSLIAMRKFGVEPNSIATIFISHLHGDHFGGLPFFLLDAQFYSRRRGALTLVGPPGFRERLSQAMEVFFPGSSRTERKFDIEILEIEAGAAREINGIQVQPFIVEHACGAPPFALRLRCEGKVLVYSGDSEWTDTLIEAARGADVFVVEALSDTRKIKFHMDYATLKQNLSRIGAKRVVLTHMGPEMLAKIGNVPEDIAEDGKILEI
ncbi:MAG: MBL fold metallo-hydrolase [Proteobacteria bacterium]|nr:MBL fold metallo-hydrolase [Pseudomonadota bacterium]